jgi:hypothetical protein
MEYHDHDRDRIGEGLDDVMVSWTNLATSVGAQRGDLAKEDR